MVLSKENPEPLLVQVLMSLRPAIFLAVFCVQYIWNPCLLKGIDDEEIDDDDEKGHEEAVAAVPDTESLSQWSYNFEKYNFFGKLCVLCVDMYLHQMVYPGGFNQCWAVIQFGWLELLVPVCKNQTQSRSDFGFGSGTGTGIFCK